MSLEELYYAFSIAFFISFWVLIVVAMVALTLLYRRFQSLKQGLGGKSLTFLAGAAPILPFLLPVIQKGWRLLNKRKG